MWEAQMWKGRYAVFLTLLSIILDKIYLTKFFFFLTPQEKTCTTNTRRWQVKNGVP